MADNSSASVSSADPALRPGDKVKITVFGEDRLTGDYQLDASGRISVPLIGPVAAGSLTRAGLQHAVEQRLEANYLKSPRVTVDRSSALPFYIVGEVEHPGRYDYEGGLDVWRAIALAGGQTYRASTDTVFVQHADGADWRRLSMSTAVKIDPGDLIRVPDRWF